MDSGSEVARDEYNKEREKQIAREKDFACYCAPGFWEVLGEEQTGCRSGGNWALGRFGAAAAAPQLRSGAEPAPATGPVPAALGPGAARVRGRRGLLGGLFRGSDPDSVRRAKVKAIREKWATMFKKPQEELGKACMKGRGGMECRMRDKLEYMQPNRNDLPESIKKKHREVEDLNKLLERVGARGWKAHMEDAAVPMAYWQNGKNWWENYRQGFCRLPGGWRFLGPSFRNDATGKVSRVLPKEPWLEKAALPPPPPPPPKAEELKKWLHRFYQQEGRTAKTDEQILTILGSWGAHPQALKKKLEEKYNTKINDFPGQQVKN